MAEPEAVLEQVLGPDPEGVPAEAHSVPERERDQESSEPVPGRARVPVRAFAREWPRVHWERERSGPVDRPAKWQADSSDHCWVRKDAKAERWAGPESVAGRQAAAEA